MGAMSVGSGLVAESGPSRSYVLIWSACSVLLGLLLLVSPVASAARLATIVAACWLLGGIVSTIAELWRRRAMWGWRLAGGVISVLCGLVVLAYPSFSSYVLVQSLFLVLAASMLLVGGVAFYASESTAATIVAMLLVIIGLMFVSVGIVALVSLVHWIGLLWVAGGLMGGVAAVAGRQRPAGI